MLKSLNIKTTTKLPKCDFCGKNAIYDSQLKNGKWGYMCTKCSHNSYLRVGSEFKLVKKKKPMLPEGFHANTNTLGESVICPSCNELCFVEPDATKGCCQVCDQVFSCTPLC